MKRLFATIGLAVVVALTFAVPQGAHAALQPPGGGGGGSTTGNSSCGGGLAGFLGFKPWDACLQHNATTGTAEFTDLADIWLVAVVIIEDLIKVAGYLAVGFVIWGGIKYIKSQGDPSETTQARQILNNALLGLVICLIAIAIVQFIAGTFT